MALDFEPDIDSPNEEDREHLYAHWNESCRRCQLAYKKFAKGEIIKRYYW